MELEFKKIIKEHKALLIIALIIGTLFVYQNFQPQFQLNQNLYSISYPLVDETENAKTYMFSIYADDSICRKAEYPLKVGLSYDYEQKPAITKTKYNFRGNNMGIDCKVFLVDNKFEPRCNVDQSKLNEICDCVNPPNSECKIKESYLGSLGNIWVTSEKGVEPIQLTTIIEVLGVLGIIGILIS